MRPIEVAFFTRKPQPGQVSIERVFRSVCQALPSNVYRRFFEVPNPSTSVRNATANILASRSRQANINHITGDVHYLAAGLDPKRTVLTIHDFVSLHRLTGLKRSVFYYLWYVIPTRRCAAITVPSDRTVQELRRWLPKCRAPIHVVPNPLPPAFQHSPKPFDKANPRFLHLGTKSNKNLERTARALEGLPGTLTVVGRLSDTQRSLLGSLNLRVDNRFDLSDDEVVQCYRECDVVLFASTYEGFGLPVIEANGIGRPVLTSDLSPMKEVAAGSAYLVDPENVDSIRQGVLQIIEDDPLRASRIEQGLENAKLYDPHRVADEYVAIYQDIVERAA